MDSKQLPEGWKLKKLGEVYDVRDGTHDSPKYLSEGYPLITSKNLKPNGLSFDNIKYISEIDFNKINERSLVHKGDILVAMIGTIGNPTVVELEPDFAIKNVALIKVVNNQNSYFLKYYLETDYVRSKMQREAKGTTQKFVGLGYLRDFPIICPPVDEQKRIVAILDEAFEGIDQAIRNTEKNLTNARELFDSYLNKIFTQKGDGWEEKRLADIAEVQSGGTPSRSKSNYWGGEMAWYSSGELNKLYTTKPERTITDEGLVNSNAKLFPKGSLLVGMYDTAALKMSILDREAAFNQAIAGVKPNDKINLSFFLHSINFVKPEILSLRRGVRQKNLSLQKIKDISLIVPSLEEQKKVVLQLASIRKETQQLETIYRQKLAALNELKQSILQKAFTGQLTSKNC